MKKLFFKNSESLINVQNIRPIWLLVLGTVLMFLSQFTRNIDLLAWVSMVPFLVYLQLKTSWRSRLSVFLTLLIAWSLIVSKIITDPLPIVFTLLYSVPITVFHFVGYLAYAKLSHTKIDSLVFPVAMVIIEWMQYTLTPFASWGIAAYTQLDSINLLQSVSLFGMGGLSFLIYWTNAALADLLLARKSIKQSLALPLGLILLFSVYGHLRNDSFRTNGNKTLTVAAVGTDSQIAGMPLPDFDANVEDIKAIFERTAKAADLGAQLVVWNEGSFYLTQENEAAWLDSISQIATEKRIGLTASYIVPVSFEPFLYENKYVMFSPNGLIDHSYLKHEPVPGEMAVKGKEEIVSTKMFNTNISGAICYDYDFPYLAKEHNQAKADIVALPSSDWRGIDPIHTQMASLRAIEQGHSVIRSTRFGLSAIINPNGEMQAQMSSFDDNEKILVGSVSSERVFTLYSVIGDVVVYISMVLLGLTFLSLVKTKSRANSKRNQPAVFLRHSHSESSY